MRKRIFVICFIILAINIVHGQSITKNHTDDKNEAKRIWEMAIQAKGGREKLNTIKNIVVSSRSKVRYSAFKTYENVVESLYVFPDREWRWDDNRPSQFGLIMTMHDYKNKLKYSKVLGNPDETQKLVPFEPNEILDDKLTKIIPFLLETSSLSPVPERVVKENNLLRNADVVQTSLNNMRIDFAFDKKSHLLIKLIGYYSSKSSLKPQTNIYEFSDYINVDGIAMPKKMRTVGNDGGIEFLEYEFNVDFKEDLFNSPPAIEDGPKAWKKKD